MFSKTKKIFLISFFIILTSLLFSNSNFLVLAAECGKNPPKNVFQSYFNSLLSFIGKITKSFDYEVGLAADPDPDFCGSDSVGCSGSNPIAIINWTPASSLWPEWFCAYVVTINDGGKKIYERRLNSYYQPNAITSLSVPAGILSNNKTYTWSVEAMYTEEPYTCGLVPDYRSSYWGVTGQPYGSFTTPTCSNRHPEAKKLTIESGNFCSSSPVGSLFFSWIYEDQDGDKETKFDFRIIDQNGNEVVKRSVPVNLDSGSRNTQAVLVVLSSQGDMLSYSKEYYWSVRVWDSFGNNSGWISGGEFETPSHPYPAVKIDYNPKRPFINETVSFVDNSICYNNAGNEVSCQSRLWTFPDGSPPSSNLKKVDVRFSAETSNQKEVILKVCDGANFSGFCCEKSETISFSGKVPGWKEIPPF